MPKNSSGTKEAAGHAVPEDIAQFSFETALAELEDIVGRLESGKVGLEESITIYERGAALKAHCEAKLRNAQARVDKIVIGADGEISAEPAKFE
jgi:exodeoxyribonuclease VII small subunit